MDNYDGMVTHLEPDILEYEVKWVLRSIILNNSVEGTIPSTSFICSNAS